jgi:hypothetical protein
MSEVMVREWSLTVVSNVRSRVFTIHQRRVEKANSSPLSVLMSVFAYLICAMQSAVWYVVITSHPINTTTIETLERRG